MKLKTHEEMEQFYKEKFYKKWLSEGMKDEFIDFIEKNLIDIDDFILRVGHELTMRMTHYEIMNMFKFIRSELWDMGINFTKGGYGDLYISKRKKEDKYSNFLTYYLRDVMKSPYFEMPVYSSYDEITDIQIITGKSRDEASKIFYAANKTENPYVIKEEPKDTKKLYGKPVNKIKNNKTTVNVVNITTESSPLEEANVTTDVTEALEQTLATDDSE